MGYRRNQRENLKDAWNEWRYQHSIPKLLGYDQGSVKRKDHFTQHLCQEIRKTPSKQANHTSKEIEKNSKTILISIKRDATKKGKK